ncbi:MAG: SRPBCC domain-containing protein [Deltaproteobacteria bacterium]|nr:SRPBCC domain-containing protein [Deltaproteobacteria bacterium]
MKLNVLLVEDFPHPVEKVWRALTDPDALRVWLMDNDFELRAGKRFILRGRRVPPESRGWHECEVLEIEPQRRMVWSWTINEGDAPTRVEFRLEAIGRGTRLTLSHTGDLDPITISRLTQGWPGKLAELRAHLSHAI